LFFDLPSLSGFGGERDHLFMDWVPTDGTRVHVIALDGSGVVTHTAPPFFVFHHANAFEEDGQLHVDMAVYEDAEIVSDLRMDRLLEFPGRDVSRSHLQRLSIPLGAKTSVSLPRPRNLIHNSLGSFFDFPAINTLYRQKKHRFCYGLAAVRPTNFGNGLSRNDMQEGTEQVWHEPGGTVGEPLFVARPGATAEDDGVVLSFITSSDGATSLLVLDAHTWVELARARLPYAMPYRFHGTWLPL